MKEERWYMIEKTKLFLKNSLESGKYMQDHPHKLDYRYNHSLRVAHYGKIIAENEGLDVDGLVIGCLLHDLSYMEDIDSFEKHINHGRRSAELAEDFVASLDLSSNTKKDLLYGIAIHVDRKADFEWRDSLLAKSISDCDNIDRFDIYRLHENLEWDEFSALTYNKQIVYIEKRLSKLAELAKKELSSKMATKLFREKIEINRDFFLLLQKQLERKV